MSFSYNFGANPPIDYIRLLISDTQETDGGSPAVNIYIFEDSEIMAAYQIQAAQFQSSQFFSGAMGRNLPSQPVSYLRVAALLLDSLASNKSRLSSLVEVLDVKLDPSKASKSLRDQAAAYRETDDNAGAFMIIEQCNDQWSFRQRYWNEVQRQVGPGGF